MKGAVKFLHYAFAGGVPLARQINLLHKNKNLVNLVVDVVYNILYQNVVPSSPDIINDLKKYKNEVYKLVDKRTSDKSRSQILIKNPEIIKTILPLLPSIDKSIVNEPLYENVSGKRK